MSLRIFLAVTHLLGAGHLTRTAAIGRALARAGHRVTLASGGLPTSLVPTDGLEVVQLPPVRAAVGDLGTVRDEGGRRASEQFLAARREKLLAAASAARPDVLVTELYPFGRRSLAAEFEALLQAADRWSPRPLVLSSIRDILAPPSRPEKATRTRDTLLSRYDGILVHGDRNVVPLERSWPVDEAVAGMLTYTGYVGGSAGEPPAEAGESGSEVLVSGGSSSAALPLYRTALAAASQDGRRPWRILVGAGVPEADYAALAAAASGAGVSLERARPDFRALLRACHVFVGLAGYNTIVDIAETRVRAVLVPFETGGEVEQRLRAELLASRGLASLLPAAELSPEALLAAVDAAEARPRPEYATVAGDGASETARIIDRLASEHRLAFRPQARNSAA